MRRPGRSQSITVTKGVEGDQAVIWDTCLARAVARELETRLGGARARSFLLDRESRRATVWFREATLRVDLSGGAGWLVVDETTDPAEAAEPLPATLTSVDTVPDERILILRFRRVRGRKADPSLVLELATNRWNALWTEGESLKVVKRLRVDTRRPHAIGQPWTPPEGDSRLGVDGTLPPGTWQDLVGGGPDENPRRALLRSLAHVSSINASALVEAGPARGEDVWRRMATLESLDPAVLHFPTGPQPYPWPLPGVASESAPTVLDAMLRVSEETVPAAGRDDDVGAHLEREIERLERRRTRLLAELDRAGGAERVREKGQTILAWLHRIPAGADRVTVPGLDGHPTELVLDPPKRPQEQAQELFDEAARMERAARALPGEMAGVDQALERSRGAYERWREGRLAEEEVASLREEMARKGGQGTGEERATGPYRRFRSSGGLEIRVGRSSKRNDELTFHHARPDDVWLHARHAAGAHVVLRWTRDERPPARDLEEAAILAALHSKARGAAHVPVDWTRRKYVRKPRGARPGSVIVERVETLLVTPDASLAEHLADD